MKKFFIILVIIILAGLGGYGIYSYIQNQQNEDVRLAQVANDIANSPVPQLNTSGSLDEQTPRSTPLSINTTSSQSWSKLLIDGKNISYPSDWTVAQSKQPSSNCTVDCLASMQEAGSLAIKLVPPGQTVQEGYSSNIIYIDTPGEGGVPDSGEPLTCSNQPVGVFMFCAQVSDGVLRVPVGSEQSIVTEAQQIVAQSQAENPT